MEENYTIPSVVCTKCRRNTVYTGICKYIEKVEDVLSGYAIARFIQIFYVCIFVRI